MTTRITEALALARKHADTNESASIAFNDAQVLYDRGDFGIAGKRLVTSLAHAVGIFHPDYNKAHDLYVAYRMSLPAKVTG